MKKIKQIIRVIKKIVSISVFALVSTSTFCAEEFDEPDGEYQNISIRNSLDKSICLKIQDFNFYESTVDSPFKFYSTEILNIPSNNESIYKYQINPFIDHDNPSYTLLRFTVLKQSTLDRYSGKIEEVLEKNIYDSVFVYSLAELKAMNYRITYSED